MRHHFRREQAQTIKDFLLRDYLHHVNDEVQVIRSYVLGETYRLDHTRRVAAAQSVLWSGFPFRRLAPAGWPGPH